MCDRSEGGYSFHIPVSGDGLDADLLEVLVK